MGTALAMAISSQGDTPTDIVGAVAKKHSPNQSGAGQHEPAQSDMRFDLSAIKRTVPDNIQTSGLFQSKSWYVTQPPLKEQKVSLPALPPQPSTPVLPFTYIGRMVDGNSVTLFLEKNNEEYTAKVNDTVDGVYKVSDITDSDAEFIYLPMKITQKLVFDSSSAGRSSGASGEPQSISIHANMLPTLVAQPVAASINQIPSNR